MPSARAQICAFFLVALAIAPAVARVKPVEIQSIRVVPGDAGLVIEITASAPLTPRLETVENPLRLIVEVPGSLVGFVRKKVPFRNEQIKGIRISQYQTGVTRVVVDLTSPVRYNWDAMGNQLNVRLRPDESATVRPLSVPTLTPSVQPVAVPYSEGSGGALVEAGDRVSSGSSISAGEQTAVLRLSRGGEVRVCPNTTVSVNTSPTGQDLMLGMSTGAMETHYHLEDSSDSILTPDFRIVFPGPGEFNIAISADKHGNTCVSSLAGSTSSVVIAELLGNNSYEVKPAQQAMFHQGSLQRIEQPLAACGCPSRQEPVLRTSADSDAVVPEEKAGSKLQMASAADPAGEQPGTGDANLPRTNSESKSEDMKVAMEAPLVFSGKEAAKARAAAVPPAPVLEAAALPLSARPASPMPAVVVLPPDSQRNRRGFFGRLKGVFGSIFR